jgi:hypothetical protein
MHHVTEGSGGMEGRNEYQMATALLQFKKAYSDLCAASRKLPDLDVSENYPFYLLDFEELEQAVKQWCNTHSNKLMEQVPDRVDNPACVSCSRFRNGLGADGLCKGEHCPVYPYILFSREACMPLLLAHYTAIELSQLDTSILHVKYIELCNKIFAEK